MNSAGQAGDKGSQSTRRSEGVTPASVEDYARRVQELEAENSRLEMKLSQRTTYIEDQHVELCKYVNAAGDEVENLRAKLAAESYSDSSVTVR